MNGFIDMPDFGELNETLSLDMSAEETSYEVLLGKGESVKKELVLYTDINLPIEKGQILGMCNLYIEDVLLDQIPLTAKHSSKLWGIEEILQVILCQFLTFSS